MKQNWIFHLISFAINLLIVSICGYVNGLLLIKLSGDDLYFVRQGAYFEELLPFLFLCFSWLATFTIYKFKNYTKHFILFIIFNTLTSFFISMIGIINSYAYRDWDFTINDILKSIPNIFKEVIFLVIFSSILISYSQMKIGKKLLPTMYKKH